MLLWRPHYAKYANPTKIKAQFIAVCVEVGNDSTHSCVYNVSRCTAVVIHTKCSNHRLETFNSTVRGVVKPMGEFFCAWRAACPLFARFADIAHACAVEYFA